MKKSLKKGFTLVELVIVIAVIAILSAVLIPTFGNVIQNSKETAAFSDAKSAIDSYTIAQADNGNSANLGDGWVVVFTKKTGYTADATNGTGEGKIDLKDAYIFKYENGALVQKQGGKVLKGKAPDGVTLKMSGINEKSTTEGSNTSYYWETSDGFTSLPLNYSFTSAGKVEASVWWFKG